MITCTNCGHSNPEGAINCEACYVELPKMSSCPSCHAQVPEDAVFCSQCGTSLQQGVVPPSMDMATAPTQVNVGKSIPATDVVSFDPPAIGSIPATDVVIPLPDPPPIPDEVVEVTEFPDMNLGFAPTEVTPPVFPPPGIAEMSEQPTANVMPPKPPINSPLPPPPQILEMPEIPRAEVAPTPTPPISPVVPPYSSQPEAPPISSPPQPSSAPPIAAVEYSPPQPFEGFPPPPMVSASAQPTPPSPIPESPNLNRPAMPAGATQLQLPVARLLHERTNTTVDLPTNLNLVHIGKPNDRIPPDIDVSGFPDSDVVSRVHADIRIDPGGYYLEDTGSANGTYVNNQPLRPGDRYRLRAGDRIALGKEDKVSFIFQPG